MPENNRGERRNNPIIANSKPRHMMNVIDRNGFGPEIIRLSRDEGLGDRKISDRIQQEHNVYIGYRTISQYLHMFRDPVTGKILPDDKIPDIPSNAGYEIAQSIHDILAEKQIDDVTMLENLADAEMGWFRDPVNPIALKLKVAKELRECIKLKLEIGGVVKPQAQTINNNMIMDPKMMEQMMIERPEAVALLREILYLASGRVDIPEEPPIMDVEATVIPSEGGPDE